MDPLTHAASGALLALSLKDRPHSVWAVPLAALASAAPDVDIFFASSPLDFLLLHRGITHALPALPFMGLLLALLMFPWWRGTARDQGSFGKTCALAMALVLLHIWLDCVTTYGTMIFLPFSEYRVRLNGIFIVDLLLVLPMLAALWAQKKRRGASYYIHAARARRAAAAGLIWVFLYPAACVGLRTLHQHKAEASLTEQGAEMVTVLPDALAPLYWRLIYADNTPYSPPDQKTATGPSGSATPSEQYIMPPTRRSVHHQSLNWRGNPRGSAFTYAAADEELTSSLAAASGMAAAFFDFTLLPLQDQKLLPLPQADAQNPTLEYRFYDLRFATLLPFVQRIMHMRNDGAPSFLLLGQRSQGQWTAVRMLFSGASRDSGWQPPVPPQKKPWWRWLAGLR